jgi:hypothetical protein
MTLSQHAAPPGYIGSEAWALNQIRKTAAGLRAVRELAGLPPMPRIVCLCGSTRFFDAFRAANLRLTLAGEIVLSIGCDTKSDAVLGIIANDGGAVKAGLDELHKRKIDLADYVFVLNVGGYIGESTRSEIEYAEKTGRPVEYHEAVPA